MAANMGPRLTWRLSLVLTILLAVVGVHSSPAPTETPSSSTSFKTQYPPATKGARLLRPETHGFYPTSLERDGHSWQHATPTPFSHNPLGTDNLADDFAHPKDWINWMLPNLIPGGLNRPKHNVKPIATPSPAYSKPKPGYWSPEHKLPAVHTIGIPKPTISSTTGRPSETVGHGKPVGTASDTVGVSSASAVEPTPVSVADEKPSATHQDHTKAPIATASSSITAMSNAQDVFQPVATGPIPRTISARDDHPVPKKGIKSEVPIETNKFYSGLFLGTQTNATFTHPYELAWAKGTGNLASWGMGITHVEGGVAKGPKNEKIPGHPVSFYVNPIGIQSIILGATELRNSTVLDTENPLPFSANAVLRPKDGANESITFPVVQGMGYVSGVYSDLQPVIQSSVHYKKVVSAGSPRHGIFKYIITLEDNATWLLYLTPDDGKNPDLKLESSTDLRGPRGWSGTIQVAKNPAGRSGEKLYDNSAGVFALEGAVAGNVSNKTGTYNLMWAKAGKDAQNIPLIMFALPHHVESFDRSTQGRMTNITLRTTTKGNATAVIGEIWTMTEPDLPIDLGLETRSLSTGRISAISQGARQVILDAARKDLNNSVSKESDLNSMYFSGKALSKYAILVHTVSKIGGDPHLASSTLQDLKHAFSRFVNNTQQFPLVYDNVWKGVVSSASYDGGDVGADFGNTLYNDHHFHYGYFIHAAAVIGQLDPAWVKHNKDWVNMLVRDAGNAAGNDPYFPFSRGFDWFHGHSWAKGLFESFDGKDQESSSEDTMFAYAIKLWGKTVGDASMEARGNLMLGILRRTLHNYFLLESDNKNHPADFIANKVTGILFENKVDHTTYFGGNLEYVHGIHMLPLLPASVYARRPKFVKEEWNALFAHNATTPAEKVEGGWKGVLYSNLALIDPKASWDFFAQRNFNYTWIDGGTTRTYSLAFAAGLGGGPSS